jgi:hypothetical protein
MELVHVSGAVPQDRLADYYRMLADLNAPAVHPALAGPAVALADLLNEGGPVREYWRRLSPHAKNIHTLLALNPKKRYDGQELADKLQIPNGRSGVAGAWAWPGRHAKELGMEYPWSWHSDGVETSYWFEEAEAEMFRPYAEKWLSSTEWQNLEAECWLGAPSRHDIIAAQ